MSAAPVIETLGEDALLVRLGSGIDAQVNRRVHRLAEALQRQPHAAVRELVPAYATLAVMLEPPVDAQLRDAVAEHLAALAEALDEEPEAESRPAIEIPVCYGGEHGPDLEPLANERGLSAEDFAARHAAGDYRVAMLGFAPGFPYLIGLDPTLAAPRLATPRPRVAAGSVGIADAQTGIYPRPGPGGWRLIGRTPAGLFDPRRSPPALLRPGDRVRFVAIDAERFQRLAGGRE